MAGRPPLPIGTAGRIRHDLLPTGKHRARCSFRDTDGRVREIAATGKTKGEATRRLQAAITERSKRAVSGEMSTTTTVAQLLDTWWAWRLETGRPLERSTQLAYEDVMRRVIVPGIGGLFLHEATVHRLDEWLIAQGRERLQAAELARTILRQAFALATTRQAVPSNPMLSVTRPYKPEPVPRVLTADELARLRAAVAATRQSTYLADVVEVQFGLALRIGETLALRASDLDFDGDALVVHIRRTVVAPVSGPHYLKEHTKSGPDGNRDIVAPDWVAEILRHRARFAGENGLLFTTGKGDLLSPRTVRPAFARERARAGLRKDVKMHTLRTTMLAAIEKEYGPESAAAFAGHSSVAITKRFYLPKTTRQVPDFRAGVSSLAPGSDE